jgi:hypothetical protein
MRLPRCPSWQVLVLFLLLGLLLVPIGCWPLTVLHMGPVAWLALEGIAVAALVMTSKLPTPALPQEIDAIGPDTPDAEVMTFIEAHIFDPERWESIGRKNVTLRGIRSTRKTGRIRAARDEL